MAREQIQQPSFRELLSDEGTDALAQAIEVPWSIYSLRRDARLRTIRSRSGATELCPRGALFARREDVGATPRRLAAPPSRRVAVIGTALYQGAAGAGHRKIEATRKKADAAPAPSNKAPYLDS